MDKSYYAQGQEYAELGGTFEAHIEVMIGIADEQDRIDFALGYRDVHIHTYFDRIETAFKSWSNDKHPVIIQSFYHDHEMLLKVKGIL